MFKPNFDEDAIKKLMNLKSDKIVQKSGAPKKMKVMTEMLL